MTELKASEIRSDVLFALAEGRLQALQNGAEGPYVVHLLPKRAEKLRDELARFAVGVGIPFGHAHVPRHREGDGEWDYLGFVLSDLHVYARAG